MADENWQQIRKIFDDALRCTPDQRRNFVHQACGGDKILLSEVESLLSSFDSAESFMETPAVAKVADVIEAETKKLVRGKSFAHYEILEQIGAGGMGEVYLAKDKKLDRKVAIKILNEKFSRHESNIIRFVREAKAASALNHPNILVIHEIGESEAAHYIASEYVEGKTLREILRKSNLKLSEILDLAIQIASALSAAHKARLVHRDIKPENIMIRPDGLMKVLDFGLAKLVERKNQSILGLRESTLNQNETARGVILGTVNYMSPEQAKAEKVDERTDIFSFGALVYEMIVGRTPFEGDSVSETIANLIKTEPKPLSEIAGNVPENLISIVSKMLRKNKDERYQTMKDVLTDLKELKENLSLNEKLERTASPVNQATEVLQATTGNANKQTYQTSHGFSQQIKKHKSFAALVLIALLLGFGVLGYYLLMTGKVASDKKSIAVLPVKPINTATRDELYEIGIAESLIHRLSTTKSFYVRPLSATRQYTDLAQDPIAAGREQKADYVLASNYQLADGRIRITAQLFNVATGQIEETYKSEKEESRIFAMQDAIASDLGNILFARFNVVPNKTVAKLGTINEEAYRFYLQGKNLTAKRSPSDAKKAIEYFEQAVRLDPNFANAYSAMAYAYRSSGTLGGGLPREQFEKAKEAVNKALELDPNLAEAYTVRGDLKPRYEGDWAGAESDLLRAIELEPNNDLAHEIYANFIVQRYRRFDEALAEIETALAINPGSLAPLRDRGRIFYFARRYDEAIVELKRVLEVDENFQTAYGWLWRAYAMKGDDAGAYEYFIKNRPNSDYIEPLQKAYETAGWQGLLRKRIELQKLDEHKPLINYYEMATISAMLGEKEQALEYMNKAIEKGQSQIVMFNIEPGFDSIRDDPRYEELMKRIGFK